MKTVPLTQGKVALVDDEDYEAVMRHKWCAHRHVRLGRTTWYVVRGNGLIYMHRELLGAARGQTVDHCDGDALNNQRANIRLCTNQENVASRHVAHASSGVRGAYFDGRCTLSKPWVAAVRVNYRKKYLGMFATKEEAGAVAAAARRRIFGKYAGL